MPHRTPLLLAVLVALVAIILILGHPDNQSDPEVVTDGQRFSMENFDFKRYDEQGILRYRLVSKHIEQDAVTGESIIAEPNTWLFKAGKPVWEISADSGWLNTQQTQARLNSNVVIDQIPGPGIQATTSVLDIDLSAEQAENDKPVTITMASNHLRGTGLFADFANNKLILKSEVKGHYVP